MAKRPIGIAAAAGQDRLHRLGRFDPPQRLGGRAGARRVVAAHDRCERFDCRGVPVQAGGMGGHLPDGGGGVGERPTHRLPGRVAVDAAQRPDGGLPHRWRRCGLRQQAADRGHCGAAGNGECVSGPGHDRWPWIGEQSCQGIRPQCVPVDLQSAWVRNRLCSLASHAVDPAQDCGFLQL